jgi:hypothetical protein
MRSRGQARRFFLWTVVDTGTVLLGCILGLSWGAVGVAAGLATANLVLFLPSFVYAAHGTTIRLADVLLAMVPAFLLMVLAVGAVWALTIFIPPGWHPFARLLVTGALIAAIMTCGIALVYGRSVLTLRLLRSDLA